MASNSRSETSHKVGEVNLKTGLITKLDDSRTYPERKSEEDATNSVVRGIYGLRWQTKCDTAFGFGGLGGMSQSAVAAALCQRTPNCRTCRMRPTFAANTSKFKLIRVS